MTDPIERINYQILWLELLKNEDIRSMSGRRSIQYERDGAALGALYTVKREFAELVHEAV